MGFKIRRLTVLEYASMIRKSYRVAAICSISFVMALAMGLVDFIWWALMCMMVLSAWVALFGELLMWITEKK